VVEERGSEVEEVVRGQGPGRERRRRGGRVEDELVDDLEWDSKGCHGGEVGTKRRRR